MTDQGILARKQIEAALKLCTVLLYASGYKPEKSLQHYRTIQALPWATSSRLKKMGASK